MRGRARTLEYSAALGAVAEGDQWVRSEDGDLVCQAHGYDCSPPSHLANCPWTTINSLRQHPAVLTVEGD
jgi:hypothetical protein